jgi:hypothetical protein|uniref:acyl-CoA reductase n=1 Tax=Polaribacter sp. TaxID=1920175 RepID=UPI004047605D
MNRIQNRIQAFVQLGTFLSQFSEKGIVKKENIAHNDLFFDGLKHQIKLANESNSWFTKENILFSLESWSNVLTHKNLSHWTSSLENPKETKNIAIIMAGNIPLVGFHDFLSVLISGHSALVKQSSNDKHLLPFLAKYLEFVDPNFKGCIRFTEENLSNYDAVIATGSNNTARYFEYYFKGKPNIIRKSRNSAAVLTGNETTEELTALSEDVFRYFGLGCRSVSKLFVPRGYNFDAFFNGMFAKKEIISNAKYANNYDYNKAVYLMSLFDLLENGFLMLKEDSSYSSPIATVFYEYYEDIDQLKDQLLKDSEKIQCIVSNGVLADEVPFGKTQEPQLWDYADGVNTLEFLSKV